MSDNTPTTATAAMSELLRIYPLPWQIWKGPTYDQILSCHNIAIPLHEIVSAVNATGTGDKQLIGELKNEVFNLRSALAAAREQLTAARLLHDKMVAELDAARLLLKQLRDHLLPYADNDSTLRMDLNDIDDALSPSQPTPTCTCHPDDNPPVPCPQKHALSECRNAVQPTPDAGELTDEEWIERAKTPGFALRAAGGGGEGQ